MSNVMDLNASPLPEDDEGYFEQHSAEDVMPHGRESSVETLHREREERRRRMRSDLVDDRPVRKNRPLDQDEGPQLKKFKSDRNKLPSGWLDCPNFGQEIAFTIPSKVPLDESFNDCIPAGKRYSFRQVPLQGENFKVGMVVDLTNTNRYYSTSDFKKQGVKYLKIRCQGRDAVPDNEAVNTFVFEVAQYLSNQPKQQPKKHVFVHCTHGHNRTGYMIVNYLMRTQQATSVTEAIQRFSKSRPPGIYKQDYIDSLYAFYHEPKPELVVCPPTPEWKRSSDFDLNGEALPEDDDGVPYAPINEKQENIVLMTNDNVLGDKIPDEQELQLRRLCLNMLRLRAPTRGSSQFPGSHPVSLDRENLQLLRQRYYYATWKADGTRYMLLLSADGCYLVDRSFKFRRVQMRFPCKNRNECHHFTLLDGEMIIDTIGPEKQERRYLIYDLIALNRVSMIERPFCERWKMIDKEIIEPRYHDREHRKAPYRYDLEPFRVRRKDFWLLSTARKLLKDFIPKLSHDADGLIFQGWDDPYVPRTHEGLLKWKYPEMNSVDFLFEIREDGAECLYLHEGGKKRLMDNDGVVFGDAFEPSSSYSGKIIECSWDSEENVWVCMRVRVDKSTPNEFNTYRKVMKSIKDNITEEVLLNEIDEIISLPMYADRIQIDSRSQKKGKQPPKKM
ncbi:uncharacterized protein LOC141647644 isoform X2 [Silene latifolia]|uniref:uncharacterized protein LOC141647644 isoform X2 n=2 Tax=Silene latifolia TaxID=37657 RepID=UPI003D76E917